MKTKLPTPQLLPSGQYRCQAMVSGKRVSVVDADSDVAQAKAVALKNGLIKKEKCPSDMTVGEAMDRYIESKDAVLSPSTIRGYKKIRKNNLQDLMSVRFPVLTQEKIQRAINAMAKESSPKSVRNAHGLLSATLAEYWPELVLRTTLPQKRRYDAKIPTMGEVEKMIEASVGTQLELPLLLAVWIGLRESEIRGISWDSIEGDTLHVKQAMVDSENGPALKGTKTYSGDRKIKLPEYINRLIEAQPHKNDYVVQLSGQGIYLRFTDMCKKLGLPHYRFHDLRHLQASVMLALGVPDKYAMERMGHATNNMLKTVYQHTMTDKRDEVSDAVDNYFSEKLHTVLHTEKRRA